MSEDQFSPSQVELIKHTIAKGATDDELALFMATCKRTGMDPFSRQIYMIERRFKDKDNQWQRKMEIQASIDGFRVVAGRSGEYKGQSGPFWCGQDGKWVDVWLSDYPPAAAKVGVLKNNFSEPLWGVATWKSYAQTYPDGNPNKMWAKMGDVMLAKCAEAIALRRAFPNDLSGVYEQTEMSQVDNPTIKPAHSPNVQLPPSTQATEKVIDERVPKEFLEIKRANEANHAYFNQHTASNDGNKVGVYQASKIAAAVSEEKKIKNYASDAEIGPPAWVTDTQPGEPSLDFLTDSARPSPTSGRDYTKEDIDNFIIKFGKFTGKKISDVRLNELTSYIDYLIKQSGPNELSKNVRELSDMVNLVVQHGRS